MVAEWLERPPPEQEVMGSIPGRNRPKSLKMVVVDFPLGVQEYENCLLQVMFFKDSTSLLSLITVLQFAKIVDLRANKVAMEQMAIIGTFEPVLKSQ